GGGIEYGGEEWACGDNVIFTYRDIPVAYGSVHNSATNECWLDRNLGASQVATAYNDSLAYGDLFQWGRLDDGHQDRNSPTTLMCFMGSGYCSAFDDPGHSNFIPVAVTACGGVECDWRFPQNNNLWQGVSGINNPCPSGWRMPTETEWDTERASWSQQNRNGAFFSPLKLTAAGNRYFGDAIVGSGGISGNYWSSGTWNVFADFLSFYGSGVSMESNARAYGFSVRCLKD
ncbi:hypothetical protein KAS79_04065, partial [Candidatus Parcubacteria bacterium]|nr:hypothetical protein [Candidatus Parcubacteria bacterium]